MTTIIWDFDYTLFETAKMKDTIRQAVDACGIEVDTFNETYRETFKRNGDYSPDYHFQLLGERIMDMQLAQDARSEFDNIIANAGDFLFPGAIELLDRLNASGVHQVLLTLGNHEYQGAKVDNCGLNEIMDEVHIVDDNKDKWLAGFKTGGEIIVINDNGGEVLAMQKACPQHRYILVKGPKDIPFELELTPVKGMDKIEKLIGLT